MDRWKWVDDLTTIEIVDLITVGLSSYNFREHVASDIPMHGQFVAPENLKTQKYSSTLDTWSTEHKMKLNKKKTTIMLINFTKKYQFSTRLKLNDTNIEQVKNIKVLGTILSDDLSWDANCYAISRQDLLQSSRAVYCYLQGSINKTTNYKMIHWKKLMKRKLSKNLHFFIKNGLK